MGFLNKKKQKIMPLEITNGIGKVGVRLVAATPSYDSDAQAFITAAGLTDTTQKNAVNELVLDLKAAGVWTKMKALYPMVGGTATTHKFNLKDPRDLDAAYRLRFFGGGTHGPNGYQPNGTDAYADTFLTPSTSLSLINTHLSYYSRTNLAESKYDMGSIENVGGANVNVYNMLITRYTGNLSYFGINVNESTVVSTSVTNSDSRGLFMGNRTASNVLNGFRNSTKIFNSSVISSALPNRKIFLSALNNNNTAGFFSSKECAFASIGDGLTDLESNLFYQIVEKYQYALGRNVNPNQSFYYNRNYTNETNAFIFNGAISDATQISAVNTLVTTLKAAGIWTKMKAVYPMVGGTALAHKFNLVNPIDSTSAYALTFNGGWTHSATGALPNGTTGYANTNLNENTVLNNNNEHLSVYSRTNSDGLICDIGLNFDYLIESNIFAKYNNLFYPRNQATNNGISNTISSLGLFISNRISSTEVRANQNGTLKLITNSSSGKSNGNIFIGALNRIGLNDIAFYSNRQYAFASIGNGLTDAEATTFYNAVQAFQTTLGRQV